MAEEATNRADESAAAASDIVDQSADSVQKNARPAADEASDRIKQGAKSVSEAAPRARDDATGAVDNAAKTVKEQAPQIGDRASKVEAGQQSCPPTDYHVVHGDMCTNSCCVYGPVVFIHAHITARKDQAATTVCCCPQVQMCLQTIHTLARALTPTQTSYTFACCPSAAAHRTAPSHALHSPSRLRFRAVSLHVQGTHL